MRHPYRPVHRANRPKPFGANWWAEEDAVYDGILRPVVFVDNADLTGRADLTYSSGDVAKRADENGELTLA